MKIRETQRPINNFKGLVPQRYLKDLAKQNTPESRKILNSCLGFNALYKGAQSVDPARVVKDFQDKYNIIADFGNNPLVACCAAQTANIFHKLGLEKPTNIFFKDFKYTAYDDTLGICICNTKDDVLYQKFHKDFPLRTVIFNSNFNWDRIQEAMINAKEEGTYSTGHFLGVFIHEFVHSAHLENLMRRHNNGMKRMHKFIDDFKNKDTIAMIKKETSKYGATKPCEMIAEEMTELIVESLDPKTIMPNNAIFKMARAKEPFEMDKLITACWNGDMAEVEKYRKQKYAVIEYIKKLVGKN